MAKIFFHGLSKALRFVNSFAFFKFEILVIGRNQAAFEKTPAELFPLGPFNAVYFLCVELFALLNWLNRRI